MSAGSRLPTLRDVAGDDRVLRRRVDMYYSPALRRPSRARETAPNKRCARAQIHNADHNKRRLEVILTLHGVVQLHAIDVLF